MRVDLEEFDFDIEFVAGKSNVCADALSRIVIPTTSEQLKTSSILIMVNTRAMVKKKTTVKIPTDSKEADSKNDHLTAWHTENPSQTIKLLKLGCEVHNNQLRMIIFNHNYKKILGTTYVPLKRAIGSQTLEFAVLEIGEIWKKYYSYVDRGHFI